MRTDENKNIKANENTFSRMVTWQEKDHVVVYCLWFHLQPDPRAPREPQRGSTSIRKQNWWLSQWLTFFFCLQNVITDINLLTGMRTSLLWGTATAPSWFFILFVIKFLSLNNVDSFTFRPTEFWLVLCVHLLARYCTYIYKYERESLKEQQVHPSASTTHRWTLWSRLPPWN